MPRLLPLTPILIGLLALGAACGDDDDRPRSPADGVAEVTRQVFAAAASERAPGQEVGLSRVIVPAGEEIAPHTHPGTQLAVIVEGTLTYTVYAGEVTVTRGAGSASPRTERIGAGATTELNAGDALVETPGMQHSARNAGTEPVVIYLASLFEAGAPASSPADVRR